VHFFVAVSGVGVVLALNGYRVIGICGHLIEYSSFCPASMLIAANFV
jgi:hypothetical protein